MRIANTTIDKIFGKSAYFVFVDFVNFLMLFVSVR